jgi:hypothetical protein
VHPERVVRRAAATGLDAAVPAGDGNPRCAIGDSSNLYEFWGAQIAQYLNRRLAEDKTPVVVNLASQEYFKAVDRQVLKARIVECVFEDWKSGQYKIISFFAKKARGLMARYAITPPGQLHPGSWNRSISMATASTPGPRSRIGWYSGGG